MENEAEDKILNSVNLFLEIIFQHMNHDIQ